MERKIASIRTIDDIKPIKGADRILLAVVGGWMTVIPVADSLSIGDHVVFVEIDGFVPTELAPFLTAPGHTPREYNGVSGERLKTRKFKGELSQGLIISLQKCRHLIPDDVVIEDGLDVASYLNIQKWEPYISPQMQGVMKGNFPTHIIPKTDQERVQNLKRTIFENPANSEALYEITLKLDGSSMTGYFHCGSIGVCSRNVELKLTDNDDNQFVIMFEKTGLASALIALSMNIGVQMELMGPKIQGNRENLKDYQLYVYDIYDIDNHRYFNPAQRFEIFHKLRQLGFTGEHVPIIQSNARLPGRSVDELLIFADGPSISNSIREGLVYKRCDGLFSFKTISNLYLLKNDV